MVEYAESITYEDFKVHKTVQKELVKSEDLLGKSEGEVIIYDHPLAQVIYDKNNINLDKYLKKNMQYY